eukprot:3357608-Alexandrium_andersonii.AAC.1
MALWTSSRNVALRPDSVVSAIRPGEDLLEGDALAFAFRLAIFLGAVEEVFALTAAKSACLSAIFLGGMEATGLLHLDEERCHLLGVLALHDGVRDV